MHRLTNRPPNLAVPPSVKLVAIRLIALVLLAAAALTIVNCSGDGIGSTEAAPTPVPGPDPIRCIQGAGRVPSLRRAFRNGNLL